jgi:N-acetylneuraminic acid mutarotase
MVILLETKFTREILVMRKFSILLLLLAVLGMVLPTFAQTDDEAWEELAPLLLARSEHAATYVIGGFGADYSDTRTPQTFEVYDPATDTWTGLPDFPETGRHHLMMTAFEDKIYVFGGTYIAYKGGLNSLQPFVYDPATETWSKAELMPSRRTAGVAVVLDEFIYIVGGEGVSDLSKMNLLRYDPANDTWAELAVPNEIRDHVAAVAYDGQIWAIGGRAIGQEDFASVEIYDPATDTWTEGPELNIGRAGFGATVIEDKIYVAGGELLASCQSFPCGSAKVEASMEMYDPATEAWTVVTDLPVALHGLPLVSLDGQIYVIGGSVQAAGVDNPGGVFRYTPEEE